MKLINVLSLTLSLTPFAVSQSPYTASDLHSALVETATYLQSINTTLTTVPQSISSISNELYSTQYYLQSTAQGIRDSNGLQQNLTTTTQSLLSTDFLNITTGLANTASAITSGLLIVPESGGTQYADIFLAILSAIQHLLVFLVYSLPGNILELGRGECRMDAAFFSGALYLLETGRVAPAGVLGPVPSCG